MTSGRVKAARKNLESKWGPENTSANPVAHISLPNRLVAFRLVPSRQVDRTGTKHLADFPARDQSLCLHHLLWPDRLPCVQKNEKLVALAYRRRRTVNR
jgi:hypothetical protein